MVDIKRLQQLREGHTLEFKTSFADQDDIIDTLAAFSNASGGTVVVGIGPYPAHDVAGVALGANTLEQFAVRLRERTGGLPGFASETLFYNGKTVVSLTVLQHAPGKLFLSGGCAWIRVANTNQKMTVDQIRSRLLDDPQLASDRPRFCIEGGWVTNPRDANYVELGKTVVQVGGEFIESVEWRFAGPMVNPPMTWERARIQRASNRWTAALLRMIDKTASNATDGKSADGRFTVELRFRWRATMWYQFHRFPMNDWDIGREILPSRCKREDSDWSDAS